MCGGNNHESKNYSFEERVYSEYADEFLTDGSSVGACPELEVGNEFVYEGGAVMPMDFLHMHGLICTLQYVLLCRVER